MCTPFDEASVDRIVEDGFDILKIASCSFTDWPLARGDRTTSLPVVGSTAGIELIDIDNIVSFMRHRERDFALMACVAQYPTPSCDLQLNQVDLLRQRYPHLRIGYSTHEDPDETLPIAMAIAKGATLFEKHVGIPTEAYALNAYSASPVQARDWLDAAKKAYACAGASGARVEPLAANSRRLQRPAPGRLRQASDRQGSASRPRTSSSRSPRSRVRSPRTTGRNTRTTPRPTTFPPRRRSRRRRRGARRSGRRSCRSWSA